MKLKVHELQKRNLITVSKSLIFTIGTVLLSFTSANAETNGNVRMTAQTAVSVGDSTDVEAEMLFVTTAKPVEEVIAEDNQIVENQTETVAPLLPGKSTEEVIADDTRIVEGVNTKVYPLDFGKINKRVNQERKPLKLNGKRLIGSL